MEEHARVGSGQQRSMGKITNLERAMERWTATAWSAVRRPKKKQKPMEVVAILRRECDANAMILGRGRTLVPNHFSIDLPRTSHRQLAVHDGQLAPQLTAQIRRYAAEQRYHFAGPVTVDLYAHTECERVRYRVRSHIAPARRPAAPADDHTKALPVIVPPDAPTTPPDVPNSARHTGS